MRLYAFVETLTAEHQYMTVLSNEDIGASIDAGNLVRGGVPAQIGPACYELRMGSIYYDLTEGDKRIDASESGKVLIKPGHRVVLITLEELAIPNDIIARVTSKGSLFSVGLSPASTYADPGFTGNLGVVTQNLSDKYIELPVGESIAKVDFTHLSQSSTNPYKGQHGYQTEIWPIKHQLQKTYEEVSGDSRMESELAEAYKILPRATASVLKRVAIRQRRIDLALLLVLFVNTLILASLSKSWLDPIIGVVTNLVASALIGLYMWRSKVGG